MAEIHVVPVVGVTFAPGYPGNIRRLAEICAENPRPGEEEIPVVLMRNPDNEHDANAVEVHVPSIGAMIGHCSRIIAARLAPSMDAGVKFLAWVHWVRIDPEHPDNPGIDIAFRRAEQE